MHAQMIAFNAIPVKINRHPSIPYNGITIAMKCGNKMGPNPVSVHDSPVAMRRFSLKYVFNASEFADEFNPDPRPKLHKETPN